MPRLRADIPNRPAYLLGLHAVRLLARAHPLEEMVRWTPRQAEEKVLMALRALAAGAAGTETR